MDFSRITGNESSSSDRVNDKTQAGERKELISFPEPKKGAGLSTLKSIAAGLGGVAIPVLLFQGLVQVKNSLLNYTGSSGEFLNTARTQH